ncbi:GDYXXLXY domain-containing protein [bacterium]|nr:GDYXXLXY domain-containing protein [bacterium]
MSRGRLLAGAVLLQVLLVAGVYLYSASRNDTGTKVLLESRPVDPYSPFRGRHAVIRLAISDLPAKMTTPKPRDPNPRGLKDWVYVSLEPGDVYWRVTGVYSRPPDGGVFIKGWLVGGKVGYPVREFFLSERGADRLLELIREPRAMQNLLGEDSGDYPLGIEVSLGADGSAIPVALYWGEEEIR